MTHACDSPADVSAGGHCAARDRPTGHELGVLSEVARRRPHRIRGGRYLLDDERFLTPWRAMSAHPGPSVRPGERRQRSGDSHDLVWIDHQIQNLVPWADVAPRMARQRPRRLIIQTIRRDPTGSVWTDDASNLSRPDPSGPVQIDAEHPSRNRKVAGRLSGKDARRELRGQIIPCLQGRGGAVRPSAAPAPVGAPGGW
jgi:hypothetical protein